MINNKKTPYEAPEMIAMAIAVENVICGLSTGEKFGSQQDYSSGWKEED